MKKIISLILFLTNLSFADQNFGQFEEDISWLDKQIDSKKGELAQVKTQTPESKKIQSQIDQWQMQKATLQSSLVRKVTGVGLPLNLYTGKEAPKDILRNLEDLVSPIIDRLKRASARPRKIEAIRTSIDEKEQQIELYETALSKIKQNQKFKTNETLARLIAPIQSQIENKIKKLKLELRSNKETLSGLQSNASSLLTEVSAFFGQFFQSKGKNLLISILVYFGVFFFLIKLRGPIFAIPFFGKNLHGLTKMFKAIYFSLSFVASVVLAIMSLYLLNDWILVTLWSLFAMGIIWSLRQFVPQLLEESKLIFNFGPVREGEMIRWDGLAWKIEKLNFYSTLSNPRLGGAEVRVPARLLLNKTSIKYLSETDYFPTKLGDWLLDPSGQLATVVSQGPIQVHLKYLGGHRQVHKTQDFLKLTFTNLSDGFRINKYFHLDVEDLKVGKTSISHMKQYFEDKIKQDDLVKYEVLDLGIFETTERSVKLWLGADFLGDEAPKYHMIERFLEQTFIDYTRETGLSLPYPKILLNQENLS